MSNVFMSKRNRELLGLAGLPEPEDKWHYEY